MKLMEEKKTNLIKKYLMIIDWFINDIWNKYSGRKKLVPYTVTHIPTQSWVHWVYTCKYICKSI